ncbi:conserved hypothetical protein, partial [Ixodes scapularis]
EEIQENGHECYISLKPFNENKVHDHDRWTRKYKVPACMICNDNYYASMFIPVYFHSLPVYGCHLFIKTNT